MERFAIVGDKPINTVELTVAIQILQTRRDRHILVYKRAVDPRNEAILLGELVGIDESSTGYWNRWKLVQPLTHKGETSVGNSSELSEVLAFWFKPEYQLQLVDDEGLVQALADEVCRRKGVKPKPIW